MHHRNWKTAVNYSQPSGVSPTWQWRTLCFRLTCIKPILVDPRRKRPATRRGGKPALIVATSSMSDKRRF